ncbi:hypothetical protein ACP4OV_013176 [Aristida adscensionis]
MASRSSFPLLLVSLVAATLAAAVCQGQEIPSVLFDFNLATETYGSLYTRLSRYLSQPSNPPYNPTNVRGRFVLGPRRPAFRGAPLR